MSGQSLRIECERFEAKTELKMVARLTFCRGDHIVPSFEELFPGLRKDDGLDGTSRKKHIGTDYYQVNPETTGTYLHLLSNIVINYILGCDGKPRVGSPASARQLYNHREQPRDRDQSVQLPHQCNIILPTETLLTSHFRLTANIP